jgi:sugar (glycoside-pentoside-hexuronide) transporter
MKTKNPEWMTNSRERMSYYSFFMGQDAIYAIVTTFLTTYLLFLGIDPVKSGLVMLAVKTWDAVNDVIFGVIFDSVHFKSNKKFLPWLKISTYCIPVTTVLIYIIPVNSTETFKLIWFAVAYILWDTAYTLCDVPIFGIVTAMTERLDERTSLLSYKSIWSGVGAGVATIIGMVLVGENVGLTFGLASIIVAAFAFVSMIFVNKNVQERIPPDEEEKFTMRRMFRYLFKNKYLLIYYLGYLFHAGFGVSGSLMMFVSFYMFHNSQFSLIIGALSVLPMLVCALFVPKLIKRFDKMKLYLFCCFLNIVFSILTWVAGYDNIMIFLVLSVLRSIPAAFAGVTMFMFTPDCAEYGKFKSGIEAKGITFAIQTFMAKLTGAISGSLGLFLLKFFDWTPIKAENFDQLKKLAIHQSGTAMSGLWFIYNMIPVIGMVIAFGIWCFYRLKDKEVQIMADCNSGKITREEAIRLLPEH